MYIFRVAFSFMRENMQYMHERAVLAMSPGQALSDCLAKLNVYPHCVTSFKAFVSEAQSVEDFGRDAQIMPVIGSDMRLEDLWKRKHGDS